MSANHEQRERLHEEASALYLQGDYVEALATWRRLLDADPTDERAAEGVRLCEGSADDVPSPGRAVQPVPMAVGDETERTLERLDQALSHDGVDWMDDASVGAAPGFDLTDPQEPSPIRVAPVRFDVAPPDSMGIDTPGAAGASAVRLDLNELGLFDDAVTADAATDARGTASAAAELEHRAAELMAEAMQQYERGARAEALAALNRLAILDETNEAARTFAAHIQSEMEAERATEPLSDFLAAGAELPPLPPVAAPAPLAHRPTASATPSALEDDDAPVVPSVQEDLSVALGPRVKAKLDVPTPRKMPPPKWIAIAAGVIVLGVAGFLLLGRGGDDEARPEATSAAPPVEARNRAGLGATGGRDSKDAPAGAPADHPAVPSPAPSAVNLDEILARGRAAFDAGDYKAAVLAYNQVLAVDSANGEARERLQEAGEKYRAVKAAEDGRAEAIESFNRGDYVEALRLFYRVTPENPEDQARITRYLRNGWYNLGIGSLRTGDCKTAREHFREAKQHDAEDPGVKSALSLSAKCSKATLTNDEYQAVRALAPRGLDD